MNHIKSFAKLNLFLNVTGVYKNGYHRIKSLFSLINLYDEIIYERNSLNKIRVLDEKNVLPNDNLLIKASNKLINYAGVIPFGVDFKIIKNIPIGGGLGGGSSNAAAVLKILNKLWHLRLKENQLCKIASTIGADVPFFITGNTKKVFGFGEILKNINNKINNLELILLIPQTKISTIEAYKEIDRLDLNGENYFEKKSFKNLVKGIETNNYNLIVKNIYNKFEKAIFLSNSNLSKIKEQILSSGADASFMSGSGSTMVGIYNSPQSKDKGINYLKKMGHDIIEIKLI